MVNFKDSLWGKEVNVKTFLKTWGVISKKVGTLFACKGSKRRFL